MYAHHLPTHAHLNMPSVCHAVSHSKPSGGKATVHTPEHHLQWAACVHLSMCYERAQKYEALDTAKKEKKTK